jgi:hypothetical protein
MESVPEAHRESTRAAAQPCAGERRCIRVQLSRVIAVDWSGARTGAARKIWLAEIQGGQLERLECGRERDAVTEVLVDVVRAARGRGERVLIGLDFSFGVPQWYADEQGWHTGRDVWRAFTHDRVEALLSAPTFPFWGRGAQRTRPAALHDDGPTPPLRETERMLRGRSRPFSVFQLVGAGSVGTASLRGMATLCALAEAGACIWPFDADQGGAGAVVAEVWPRLAAPAVNKSDAEARVAHVAARSGTVRGLDACLPMVRASDDAFDAVAAAVALWQSRAALTPLAADSGAAERREGRILRVDGGACGNR